MPLFLGAHISGRVIATALRDRGHDVRSADDERELDGWDDDRLLELASHEDRVMVTFNIRDFPRIVAEWAEAGRTHTGCLLIVGVDHGEFGEILRLVDAAVATRPDQQAWVGYTVWVSSTPPE